MEQTTFSVVFGISYDENASGRFAKVVGRVSAPCGYAGMVVASIEVDGIELIPSARLEFGASADDVALPEFRIFRPIPDREYTVSLNLHLADGVRTLNSVETFR